jgi:hypothetical protein
MGYDGYDNGLYTASLVGSVAAGVETTMETGRRDNYYFGTHKREREREKREKSALHPAS